MYDIFRLDGIADIDESRVFKGPAQAAWIIRLGPGSLREKAEGRLAQMLLVLAHFCDTDLAEIARSLVVSAMYDDNLINVVANLYIVRKLRAGSDIPLSRHDGELDELSS